MHAKCALIVSGDQWQMRALGATLVGVPVLLSISDAGNIQTIALSEVEFGGNTHGRCVGIGGALTLAIHFKRVLFSRRTAFGTRRCAAFTRRGGATRGRGGCARGRGGSTRGRGGATRGPPAFSVGAHISLRTGQTFRLSHSSRLTILSIGRFRHEGTSRAARKFRARVNLGCIGNTRGRSNSHRHAGTGLACLFHIIHFRSSHSCCTQRLLLFAYYWLRLIQGKAAQAKKK